MHGNIGSRLVLAFGLALVGVGTPRLAHAQVTDSADCPTTLPACSATRQNCCTANPSGSSGGILIPLDRCHQPVQTGYNPTVSDSSPNWCANATGVSNSSAMDESFGLAYRMMQWSALNPLQPIPFYWIVNPTKAPSTNSAVSDTWTTDDIDLWVLSSGSNPPNQASAITAVGSGPLKKLVDNGSAVLVTDTTWGSSGFYQRNEFPVRGSAFYIPPQYRANFNAFWAYRPAGRTGCGNGKNCYDFTDVWVYEVSSTAHFAWQDFTQALSGGAYVKNDNQMPVAMVVNYPPPKVATVMSGVVMANWLAAANLNDFATNATCATGTAYSPTDSIECRLSPAQVDAGDLISGGFTWAWLESTGTSCAEAPNLNTFLTGVTGSYSAGNVFFFNESIANVAEVCSANNMLGSTTGLSFGGTVNETASNPIIVRWPGNLFSQYGDLPLNFASGSVPSLNMMSATAANNATNLYNSVFFSGSSSTLRRLMTSETACGGAKQPSCAVNPLCTNHDDYGHTSGTSSSICDQGPTLTTASQNGAVWVPDADVNDIYVYGRYNNNTNNGVVFYAPGQNITQNGQAAQLRLVLSALIATPALRTELAPSKTEVTRSSPVPAFIGGTAALVQGSYEYNYVTYNIGGTPVQYQVPRSFPSIYTHDDVGVFTFPGQHGHMRAIPDSKVSTTAQAFPTETPIFDAATNIPSGACGTPFSTGCRTIFTTNKPGVAPTNVYLTGTGSNYGAAVYNTDGTANTLGGLMLPSVIGDATAGALNADQNTLISRVLAGDNTSGSFKPALGGVDRSTVAVIPTSGVAGTTRPTVAYFGATDGMLHAVCADNTVGVCNGKLGAELWAYVPRVNLSNLRYNNARIDGSPRVLDVQGAFTAANFPTISNPCNVGTSCFKTILTVQAGSGDATSTISAQPAIYAIDVTDPTTPTVLWEYATPAPASRTAHELGVGLTLAAGDITIVGVDTNFVIAETNNGGTGSNGVVVTAIQTDTGLQKWQFAYDYPSGAAKHGGASDADVPATGMPGGVVSIDKTDKGGNAAMSDLVFADLYGSLWELNAADGTSRYNLGGTYTLNGVATTGQPLFQFSTDYHPIGGKPAIYNNGNIMYAIVVDGGYADTSGNTGWGNNVAQHYALGISLNTPNADAIINENKGAPDEPFKLALTSGERGYSQATIVGNQIFFNTESASVNAASYGTSTIATGHTYSYNISTSTQGATVVVQNGASSIANSGTSLFASSGSTNQQLAAGALGTVGATVTAANLTNIKRQLWLRTE